MNITVYLGANEGNDPFFKEAVRELGAWIPFFTLVLDEPPSGESSTITLK